MAEYYSVNVKQRSMINGWLVIFLLFLSFCFASVYPATMVDTWSFKVGYGDFFRTENLSFLIVSVLSEALISWLFFEIIFRLYREILAYKIYSFVVPKENFKVESRLFYCYRNIIYGIFVNLCFFFPYLYLYNIFFSVIATLLMTLLYAIHIKKKYSESIIGHFVFKSFVVPLFVFEIIMIFFNLVGVIA